VTPLGGGTGGKAAPGRGFDKALHETNSDLLRILETAEWPGDFPVSRVREANSALPFRK